MNEKQSKIDDIFIGDDPAAGGGRDLSDIFIPDSSIADDSIEPTDTLPEILTNPVEAGDRAKKVFEQAMDLGISLPESEKNFRWTPERIEQTKIRFGRLFNPGGNLLSPPERFDTFETHRLMTSWWAEEGQFLPPEVLTELGIEGGDKVPTLAETIRAQKKSTTAAIKNLLGIEKVTEDPLKDQLSTTEVFDPAEPPELEQTPELKDTLKAANRQDLDLMAKFVSENLLEFPDSTAKAITDEIEIRDTIPEIAEALRDKPLLILLGTDFLDNISFGLTEFASRKGIHPTELLLEQVSDFEKGDTAIWFKAISRMREQIARNDPRLLTMIGLSSGEILADIIKFAALPDLGKAKVFSSLSKTAKAAIGVGTKVGLIELLQAPEEGETFNERLGSVIIATGSGAVAGAVFSLALSGLQAVGAKIGTKIGKLKTEALRKALIKRDPKLEGYLKTLDKSQLSNLQNAINDSVRVQTGDITQAAWDSSHKSFVTALAKDAITFAESQAGVRPTSIVPKGFRAAFAEIGPTEPGKKLAGKAAKKIAEQLAAQAKLLATIPGTNIEFDRVDSFGGNTVAFFKDGKRVHTITTRNITEAAKQVEDFKTLLVPASKTLAQPAVTKKPTKPKLPAVKPTKAPAAATGEPRTLPQSTTEQLTAEAAELEKWRQEVLSKPQTQRDEGFAKHLEKSIAEKQAEIKQIATDKDKITKLLRGKTFDPEGRNLKEIATSAAKNFVQIAKSVPDMIVKIFEPAKLVEKKLGGNVYSTVIRGISLPEVRALEFNERVLDAIDTNFGELEQFFDKFSKEELKNFMLSRGSPRGDRALEFQKEASVKVPEQLRADEFQKALQEIADFNFQKLSEIAEGDITKVKDYFYGIYDNSHNKVDKFLDHFYRTTKRFLKEKSLPTVADAKEFGLTLRSNNPVTNLKSEWAGISRLEGMQLMRDELLRFGKGEFIGSVIEDDIPDDWVKIGTEPVFAGLRADENLARLINNLISVNKINAWMPLRVMRGINNVLRIFKFAGSGFHLTVEASQAIADSPLLNPASTLRGFTTGFRENDPIFKTPEYREYIGLGAGLRTSIEAEAQALFNEIVTALGKPGAAVKTAISPLIIMNKFTEWMFNSYIPKLKYVKYLDFVSDMERKLGRGLTDPEKINIIKEGQNFYGEMNEKLFGRSGTMTSVLRFIFLAPGFAEGNYRTIAKGATQWGIGDSFSAKRSRRNVVNSLLLKLAASTIGTIILTGNLPKTPKNAEELRDLFKIDTGQTDDRGRKIFIDTLTYDKDYYNLLLGWAQHGTVSLGKEVLRRVGGMRAPLADITYDLVTVAFNKDIYDWKGDTVIKNTDPVLVKLRELALFELHKTEPISVSVLRQGLNRGMNLPVAILQAISGTRTTLSEAELRKATVLRQVYELWGEREEVFISVRTSSNPRARIAAYNKNVKRIMSSKKVDPEIREEFEEELFIDTEKFLENKAADYQSPAHTLKEVKRIKEVLVNFKIEPKGIWEVSDDLSNRLSKFTQTRRKLKSKVDEGAATPNEKLRSVVANGVQVRIAKVAKVLSEMEDPQKQQQLVDLINIALNLAETE